MDGIVSISPRNHATFCDNLRHSKISLLIEELIDKIKDLFWTTVYRFHPPATKSISKGRGLQTDLEIRKLLVSPPKNHLETIQQCAEIHSEARRFRGTPEEHHTHLQTAHVEISQILFIAQHEEYTLEIVRPRAEAPRHDPAAGVGNVLPIIQKTPVSRDYIPQVIEILINKIKQRIQAVSIEHKNFRLQNPEQAAALATSKEIGKALIAPNGTLNKGIIYELRRLLPENPLEDYQKDILRVLHALETSSKLEAILNNIVKPEVNAYQIKNVIRSVLGLPFGEEITDIHAKQAALIALLSHMRQGPVGSCFATFIAIGLLNQKLEKCLQDFAEILKTGKAVRLVEKERKEFSFKTSIADEDLTKKFKLDRYGNIFEQPGFKAAFKQMGLINLERDKKTVLERLFKNVHEETVEVDAKTLLGCFENFEMGLFAFSCETNNGLLRIWENLLAAMPEGVKGGGINTNRVIDAILAALKEQFKTSILVKGKPVVNPLKESLKGQLLNRINLVYNNQLGADGGYEMKDVENPAAFKALIVDALKDAQGDDPDNGILTTIEKVKNFISNDPLFLKNVLWAFDDANKKIENPASALERCNLPWRFEAGNSLRNTYAVEMEHPIPSPILTHPKNASELAVCFLNICKKLEKVTNVYTDTEENEKIPMETPTHAFNANVESEKVKAYLQANENPEEWLKRTLIEQSKLALRGQIDSTSRQKVYHFILNPENNLIPQNRAADFKEKFDRMPNVMQMETFSSKIMEILIELNHPDPSRKNELWQIMAAYFLSEGLPEKIRDRLDEASLPIADLSWSKDNSDLNFKVMFDVITMKPILVGINTSKTSYKVVNQNEWVTVLIKYFPTNY